MVRRSGGLPITRRVASSKWTLIPSPTIVSGVAYRSERIATTSPGFKGWLNCVTTRPLTTTASYFNQVRTCFFLADGQAAKRKERSSAGWSTVRGLCIRAEFIHEAGTRDEIER